ncbi:ankyrin repeat domain-containing protein [Roseibacillus persicicus]|nr:ankyrin repeat domain-containing protein [Roseibacillus persicicus]
MMRFFKTSLIFCLFFLLLAGTVGGYLYKKGFFADPQVALRELEKRSIPPTAASVRQAAAAGDRALLKVLARAQCDFNTPDDKGRTALHLALDGGHISALPLLREEGYDLDARDQEGNTPLSLALDRGFHEIATKFIEEGASPNFTLPNGELALPGYHHAKRQGDMSFLLRHGANPDSPDLEGQSSLALALQSGQPELACQLIERGADPNGLIFGEPALSAVLDKHQDWKLKPSAAARVLATLLVSGADPEKANSKGQRPIQAALESDFRPGLELILPRVTDVSDCLWLAIQHNNVAAIENLLGKGSPVEEVGPRGETPLLYAIRQNKPALLTALLSAGADANQFCNEGQPALFYALAHRNDEAITALLRHDNRPNLDVVMADPVSEEFRDLFERKGLFDWYCRNETGLNPLMAAVMLRNLPVTELLLELGMDRFAGTTKGVYPIQMAAANGDVKMQQLLIGVSYRDEDQVRKFVIDLSEQKVTYYKNGKVMKTSRISSGMRGFRTDTGEFVITDKTRHKRSNIYDEAPMPYFQRFSCKAIGFHEGNTYSRFASHGCIRLPRSTAQFFWKETELGDRVTIQP